jgi:hypothetical protein
MARMDAFEVRPGLGIGPFDLGATLADAIAAAERAGLTTALFRRGSSGPIGLVVADLMFIHVGATDEVEEIEVALSPEMAVVWQGLDLRGPARDVAAAFNATADATDREFPALMNYPTIGLSLWRDDKPGRPLSGVFEAVLGDLSGDIAAR